MDQCFSSNHHLTSMCMHMNVPVCAVCTHSLYQIPELLLAKTGGKKIDKENTAEAPVSGSVNHTHQSKSIIRTMNHVYEIII